MKIEFLIVAGCLIPLAAQAAARFEAPQMPISDCADTESSTNLVFDTGSAGENRWDMTFR